MTNYLIGSGGIQHSWSRRGYTFLCPPIQRKRGGKELKSIEENSSLLSENWHALYHAMLRQLGAY